MICPVCTTLTANIQGTVATTSYAVSSIPYNPYSFNTGTSVLVNIDDTWTSAISLPFCFQFFGNTYTQLLIGSNGILTFDLTNAGGFCPYDLTLSGGIPDASLPTNSIMLPYEDIDPTNLGSTDWHIYGSAPCRTLVVSFYRVPYYGDPNSINPTICSTQEFETYQVALYETTNIIDIFINNKQVCTSWNNGWAIEGIQNTAGTLAYTVPGRNNTVWTASNDAYRFTPTGATQYNLTWYAPPHVNIGTSPTITVCPTTTTTYTATVVNAACGGPITVSAPATITISNNLSATTSSTNAGCSVANGTATVTPSGGTSPYTYNWNPSAQNTPVATGLAAGIYSVTITDAGGCTKTSTVSVNASAQPIVTATSTPTGCTIANGTATANASGGTPGYTYTWTPSGGNASTANNLSVGIYIVTVTDTHGCTSTTTVSITATGAPIVTATTTPTGCTVANGSATANASGGTPGYTYTWTTTPVQNTQIANNLSSGNYTVIVSDANGCSAVTTVSVSPTGNVPSTTAATTNTVSCFGGSNGSANATPSGGTPGYTYTWTPSGQHAQIASNLSAGTYSVIVSDANGCTATTTVAISQPTTAVTATSAQTTVLCNGGTNASATVTPSGGTPGYTYTWTPTGGNAQTANNLAAGNYNVTVTDANGCPKVIAVTIIQPQPLSVPITPTNITCNGGTNGSAIANPSGGTSPYTYTWNTTPVQNTQSANNLGVGSYTVTVTDTHGCTKQSTVAITQPSPILLTVSGNDTVCKGENATLSANVNGGTPAYTYTWMPGPQNGASIVVNPTTSSNYSVAITDANGCTSAVGGLFHVTVLPAPAALFDTASSGTFATSYVFSDLSTPSVTITGWNWNFGDNSSISTQQNPVHTFPGAGTYTVTEVAFNKFGCPDTFKRVITINEGIIIPNVFTPDGDGVNDVWYIPNSGMKQFSVEIFDRWGTKVFETTADQIRWDGRSSSGKLLSDGTYFYVLKAYLKEGNGEKNYSTTGYVTLLTKK